MTGNEKRLVFIEMKQIMEQFKEEMKTQFKLELQAAVRQIHQSLTGLGVITPDEKLLSKSQVAEMYGVSRMTVQRMMNNGTLPFIKNGDSKQSHVAIRHIDAMIAFEAYKR